MRGNRKPGITARIDWRDKINIGLRGRWLFNGLTNSLVNLVDGTSAVSATPPTRTTGNFGAALAFNGTTQFITAGTPAGLEVYTNFTIVHWGWVSAFPGANSFVYAKDYSTGARGYGMGLSTSGQIYVETGGVANFNSSGNVVPLSGWFCNAIRQTKNSANNDVDLWQQGINTAGKINAGTIPTANAGASTYFGMRQYVGVPNGFPGRIDNISFYARVLNAGEIMRLFTEPFAGIVEPRRRIISLAAAAAAGIAFDAASNSGYQAASSSYTFNRTVAGANTFLAVDVSLLSAGQTVSSVIDDSAGGAVAMSFIGAKSTVTALGRVESWGLVAPAAGTKSIQVNLSAVVISASEAVSYTGVHQTSPTEAYNSAQATNVGAADATVNVTSVADNCWIHGAVVTDDTAITANQTSRNNVTGAGGSGANEDTGPITPAGATAMSYTNVGALATWAIGGYAIRPVAAAPIGQGTPWAHRFSRVGAGGHVS